MLCVSRLESPGYGGHTSAILIDEVAPSIEHPAMVKGHQGVSGGGGSVLSILTICILQGGELILPQDLENNKRPVEHRQSSRSAFRQEG